MFFPLFPGPRVTVTPLLPQNKCVAFPSLVDIVSPFLQTSPTYSIGWEDQVQEGQRHFSKAYRNHYFLTLASMKHCRGGLNKKYTWTSGYYPVVKHHVSPNRKSR